MENALFDFHHKTPKLFWASFSLNLAGQCLAILEVCIVLWLLGAHIGFFGALIIEALTKLVNAIGNFNPGNVGTYEGGNMLIGKIFSLTQRHRNGVGTCKTVASVLLDRRWRRLSGFPDRAGEKVEFGRSVEAGNHDGKYATPSDVSHALPSSSGATRLPLFLAGASTLSSGSGRDFAHCVPDDPCRAKATSRTHHRGR